jgi:site-specific recombinase XerD
MYSTPSEELIKEMKRRRYSQRTIATYAFCLSRFLNWSKKRLNEITKKDVREYLEMKNSKGQAGNTLNVNLMAIKFYFEEILGRKMAVDIKYSKTPKRIQRFLSKEETERLIYAIKNPKHRLMIALMYSAGIRVSELINLKIKDLNLKEKYGFVRNGKWGKDRVIVLAERLEIHLSAICENRNIEENVFLTNRNKKYSMKTIQVIVREAAKNAEIQNFKEIHPHTLRHSFATHLIQNNYSITDVQASLGHKSPETSLVYTHTSGRFIGIKSPLDNL